MACLPAAAVVTAALPRGASLEFAKEIYLGLREAGDVFDCPIVGGDTGSWDGKLAISVTILGRSAGIEPVTRRGAKVGDNIYVTGPLGGSLRGRHMTFEPRVHLARELATTRKVTSMIDISDGLSRDLSHICEESHVGAIIDADALPVHPDAADSQHALHDGEDYELLFTAAQCDHPAAIRIGTIVPGEGVQLRRDGKLAPLKPLGWEHPL
jgi:thiamine-monophosphate kinase